MLGAAVTLADSLAGGFDRSAARAGLPDVLATFAPTRRDEVDRVVGALANVAAVSYRLEQSGEQISAGAYFDAHATVVGVDNGRRAYAVISGRTLARPGEAVVEAGLARAWHLRVGQPIELGYSRTERFRVVGFAISPDAVAFPLARSPRVYVETGDAATLVDERADTVNGVDIWLNDPRLLDVTLSQARSAAWGVSGLQFVTRAGLHLLIGQAAGIVVAVLVAFSIVALVVASTMLAASAASETQRRLAALGLLRAIGVSRHELVAASAAEGALVALPAGAFGIVVGWVVVRGPTERLLASLNELGPGASLAALLLATLASLVALVAAASAWPAWRASRRPPIEILRGADVAAASAALPLPAGAGALGLRLVLSRPLRTAATAAVVGLAVGVVLAILAIATVLQGLNAQPQAVGKRYQLLVDAPASEARRIERLPGVASASPRYEAAVADSFALGEPFVLVAFPGDHAAYEAPPLASGRRVRTRDEAEVGVGLAQALGLDVGGVLALQLPNGREVRFHVVGTVSALQDQGRVAYIQPTRLLAADPALPAAVAVRLRPGASAAAVERALARRGRPASSAGGIAGQSVQSWAARNSGFLGILVALLRSVAAINAVVCLYAIGQALALTAHERQRALSIVRATGGSRRQIARIFASGAIFLIAAALAVGFAAERELIARGVARIAAPYVTLALGVDLATTGYVALGLLAGALVAAAWISRVVTARPVVTGLRQD